MWERRLGDEKESEKLMFGCEINFKKIKNVYKGQLGKIKIIKLNKIIWFRAKRFVYFQELHGPWRLEK